MSGGAGSGAGSATRQRGERREAAAAAFFDVWAALCREAGRAGRGSASGQGSARLTYRRGLTVAEVCGAGRRGREPAAGGAGAAFGAGEPAGRLTDEQWARLDRALEALGYPEALLSSRALGATLARIRDAWRPGGRELGSWNSGRGLVWWVRERRGEDEA